MVSIECLVCAAVHECPDHKFMCVDPGVLTCIGEDLNDYSGRWDCFKGFCYCHVGWGGAYCSQFVCLLDEGWEDVRRRCLSCITKQAARHMWK